MITNNDVISQNIGDTIRRLADMNVNPGAGTIEIHLWALQTIAQELLYYWDVIKDHKE